jgi:hypothetical protein
MLARALGSGGPGLLDCGLLQRSRMSARRRPWCGSPLMAKRPSVRASADAFVMEVTRAGPFASLPISLRHATVCSSTLRFAVRSCAADFPNLKTKRDQGNSQLVNKCIQGDGSIWLASKCFAGGAPRPFVELGCSVGPTGAPCPAQQRRAEQSRAEHSSAAQRRAEHSRAEQSRAEQSTPSVTCLLVSLGAYVCAYVLLAALLVLSCGGAAGGCDQQSELVGQLKKIAGILGITEDKLSHFRGGKSDGTSPASINLSRLSL